MDISELPTNDDILQYLLDVTMEVRNHAGATHVRRSSIKKELLRVLNFARKLQVQWKPLIMNTLGPALFDNNNRLITLSGGYKYLHYLTQFVVTTFYIYKKQQNLF